MDEELLLYFDPRESIDLRAERLHTGRFTSGSSNRWTASRGVQRSAACSRVRAGDQVSTSKTTTGLTRCNQVVHWAVATLSTRARRRLIRPLDTSTPLQYVKGIGPARAEMLET